MAYKKIEVKLYYAIKDITVLQCGKCCNYTEKSIKLDSQRTQREQERASERERHTKIVLCEINTHKTKIRLLELLLRPLIQSKRSARNP